MALVYFDVENFRAPKNKTNAISYDLSVFLFFDLMIDFFFLSRFPSKCLKKLMLGPNAFDWVLLNLQIDFGLGNIFFYY